MISQIRIYIVWFFSLLFLQVAVLNNLNAGKWFFPFAYVLFILFFPRNVPHWLLIVLGFFTGTIVDLYAQTYGTHAFATTLIAFIRPNLLNSISPADSATDNSLITVHLLGLQKFAIYALILLFIHHFFVFFIDEFSTDGFFSLILQVITSSLLSFFIIACLQFIFNKKP